MPHRHLQPDRLRRNPRRKLRNIRVCSQSLNRVVLLHQGRIIQHRMHLRMTRTAQQRNPKQHLILFKKTLRASLIMSRLRNQMMSRQRQLTPPT